MKRQIALWWLGFWTMGTAAIALVATRNFAVIDQLLDSLANPRFAEIVGELGAGPSRELLRYLSSEVNRTFFEIWGWVQLPLGALVLWLVWDESARRLRYLVIAMLAVTALLAFGLTPPIVSVGRSLDFVAREPAPPELATFGLLHAAYSIAEFGKLGMGLLLSYWLVRK